MIPENPALRLVVGTLKTLRRRIAEAGDTLEVLEVDTLLSVACLTAERQLAKIPSGDNRKSD
ncbi:hypothetical protein [Mesorhizobium sp. INR15]|uniref:hypothetical protein n=1 Tax=Mesorhizobium sp. INR15 TaxID=2654248 RepID=UPI0018967DA8|nr:hypothetical protein [Mesorhizobium sp. INR15]QPC94844.1 hypothetical protein GA829_32000 [Mesorhizobium sp. INR15]